MIDPNEVEALLRQVLATAGAPRPDVDMPPQADAFEAVRVEGVLGFYMLNLEALTKQRAAVRGWVDQLHDGFHASGGGGLSFLNLCEDAYGNQWTGLHRTCDALYVLAAGLGMAKFCMPREFWPSMPGGMPYVVFERS